MSTLADQELLAEFLTEAGELVESVDRKLVELEHRPHDAALLNDVFRGFHTIKGGAGFLDAAALVEVCHVAEHLLQDLRSGGLRLVPAMLDAILGATAAVRTMFDEMAMGGSPQPAPPDLIAALARWREDGSEAAAPPDREPTAPDWEAFYAAISGKPASIAALSRAIPSSGAERGHPSRSVSAGITRPRPSAKESTLRIDVERFDQILNLSGEIGLTKNRLTRLRTDLLGGTPGSDRLKELDQVVNTLSSLVGDLQNMVMKARMQPVGRMFQKYTRMARDLARQLGKDVDLALEGEDTEIDKTMLEALTDPIMHLVRNAIDHGVDSPEARANAGKPVRAVVRLSARQVGDAIEIAIADDGCGMNAEVLRRRAVDKGLIGAEEAASLDERAALNLIFLPGFSTRVEVSDVSGRGVGLDVVRTGVMRLNGRIDIVTRPGRGTTITITLPLTLAILPVLMFRLQKQPYAIPLAVVREIVRIAPETVQSVAGRPGLVMRGEVIPVVDLADLLGRCHDGNGIGIVIEIGNEAMVLAVDSFIGQDEVVIKALTGFKPKGVAGATLASDGMLVLVLDLVELLDGRNFLVAA